MNHNNMPAMNEEQHYNELKRLKGLANVPSVQKVLQELINKSCLREPIKVSKAQTQTIYITTGYAWSQDLKSITLYIQLINAASLTENDCRLTINERSIDLSIMNHNAAHYQFKINCLYDSVDPTKSLLRFRANKIVISLLKRNEGRIWPELRLKTTENMYLEAERREKDKRSSSTMKDNASQDHDYYITPFASEEQDTHCTNELPNNKATAAH